MPISHFPATRALLRFAREGRGRNEVVICFAVALAYLLVWPVGGYAIMDDWIYVKSLQHLHFDGHLTILDYNPMSVLGHLFWGVLFTKLFGFSFTVTKISVVVLHVIECLLLLRILALCRVTANLALIAVTALVFNPLHFVHAFMYMTDVPAIAWQVVAVYCYIRGLLAAQRRSNSESLNFIAPSMLVQPSPAQSNRTADSSHRELAPRGWPWLLAGSLAAGEAFLTRQNGVLVPAACFLYLLIFERRRSTLPILVSAILPVMVIVGMFTYWYQRIHGPTTAHLNSMREIIAFVSHPPLEDVPIIALAVFVHAGFFLLPLAMAVPLRAYRVSVLTARGALFCGFTWIALNALAYYAFTADRIFPYMWNVLTPFGLFGCDEFIIGQRDLLWGKPLGLLIGIGSLLAGLALVQRSAFRDSRPAAIPFAGIASEAPIATAPASIIADSADWPHGITTRFLLLLLGLQLAYVFATTPILFDRHLLLLAPTIILLFCVQSRQVTGLRIFRYLALLVPFMFYSVTTTHDLHALSRTAFAAGSDLTSDGVDPANINAGYAFDCWHTYERRVDSIHLLSQTPAWWHFDSWKSRFEISYRDTDALIEFRKHLWWMGTTNERLETTCAVSCSAPLTRIKSTPRYQLYREYKYHNWWPSRVKSMYVLRDANPSSIE